MPDPIDPKSFFDSVPGNYEPSVQTLEPPAPAKSAAEVKPDPEPPATPAADPKKPSTETTGDLEDLLGDDPKPGGTEKQKTPADFARERREAKEKKREILEKAPLLEEENRKLKADYEAAKARLDELESLTAKERTEQAVSNEDIETLRARAEAAERRYIQANGPDFDPYQDAEVLRHAGAVEDALRANLPKFALKGDGTRARVNIDLIRKNSPERKAAMDQAVAQYAMASEAADEAGMDKAVILMGTALGGIDIEDEEIRSSVETALAAATEPFAKGIARFRHVKENAVQFARERRAEQARVAESRLLAPFRLAPEAVEETLAKNPSHPWANFGALIQEMPEEFRGQVEESLRRDSSILGALRFTPPPLAPNASAEEIANHEAIVQAADKTLSETARYIAVGRAMIEGGLLVHLRSAVLEAKERLETESESQSIPRRGVTPAGDGKTEKSSMWEAIPSSYGRG